ncbi:YecA family protein [Undibacterium danionis]|uniref:YecA family protein n=1 Tax=Undibacterium danionis TaxID=1812100 RepID=A0ABV6IFQ0_9BURK
MTTDKTLKQSERELFLELEALCTAPGFIHAIAYFSTRDNMILYADEMKVDDLMPLHGRDRLVRNEVNALIGLMVKRDIDYTLPDEVTLERYVECSEALLEKIHGSMSSAMWKQFPQKDQWGASVLHDLKGASSSGEMMREAIFYGGESAYGFHYRDIAPLRYGRDDPWIVAHMGFSIKDAATVVKAVGHLLNEKSTDVFHSINHPRPFSQSFLPGYEFSAAEIIAKSKLPLETVEKILTAFAYPEGERNIQFNAVDDRNMAAIRPLIRRGDHYVLFNIYDLSEVLYQAPFFWILQDESYQPTAQYNRGAFTEDFAEARLVSVFGRTNVKVNVNLLRSKDVLGEFDALVFFGDLAIVLQAKSKQLTAAARKGNEAMLLSDFGSAVQKACDQGYDCGKLLLDPSVRLEDVSGVQVSKPAMISRVYVICLIADHYPALSAQARQYLKFEPLEKLAPPFVMDVFHLDVMAEMLDTPLHFLSYLDRRSNYHETVVANHELNILGFHLERNLWVEDGVNFMYLEDGVGTGLDLSMLVRRENIPGPWTPPGILTRMRQHRIGQIVKEIEKKPNPAMLALGFLILRMGEKSFVSFSKIIDDILRRAMMDGGRHDVSVPLLDGKSGLTIHVNMVSQEEAEQRLVAHCEVRKYLERAESWFGLILDACSGQIRFGLQVSGSWVYDTELEESEFFKILRRGAAAKQIALSKFKAKKIGRNDRCPCGSGRKSKRCCYS